MCTNLTLPAWSSSANRDSALAALERLNRALLISGTAVRIRRRIQESSQGMKVRYRYSACRFCEQVLASASISIRKPRTIRYLEALLMRLGMMNFSSASYFGDGFDSLAIAVVCFVFLVLFANSCCLIEICLRCCHLMH